MKRHWATILAAVLTVAVILGIAICAPFMKPSKPGTSDGFWGAACGVDITLPATSAVGAEWNAGEGTRTESDQGWFYYDVAHLHGSALYAVRESEAMRDFPRVLELLAVRAAQAPVDDPVRVGYLSWKGKDEEQRQATEGLLKEIRKAKASKYPERAGYDQFQRYLLARRVQQSKWYWANLLFEFLLLAGLAWLALWPAIRRCPPWRWALHLGLVPVLLMLPVYLGYATFSFTTAGPSGGVLYPWLVFWLPGGSCNPLDQWILERLPQVLEPMSQSIGTPMVLSGFGMYGPTAAVGLGLVVALVAWGIAFMRQRRLAGPTASRPSGSSA
jgi:hypothetical protein